jgi:uncharacterized membrane protein YeaQ/YmgE (transglycosylase-associated protein family)
MALPQRSQDTEYTREVRPSGRSLAAFLGIGLLAGWLASWIVGGAGLLQYLVTGVLGAFVGGWLSSATGIGLGIRNPMLNRIAVATIGAIIVVLFARFIA